MLGSKLKVNYLSFFPENSLLSNIPFLNLWLVQFITQVGVRLFDFVLAIQIYRYTGSNASVSYLILAYSLPALLFSSLAGVLVDKWRKKTTIILINFLRFAIVIVFVPFYKSFALILIFAFTLSLVSQFFVPIQAVLIPKLVKKSHLVTANSLFTLTLYTSAIFGFMGAGPLIKSVGDSGSFVFIAILFLTAMLLSLILPKERKKKELNTKNTFSTISFKSPYTSLVRGFKVLQNYNDLKIIMFILVFSQVMVSVYMVLTPGFVTRVMQLQPEDASVYLIGPSALGMVFGAALMSNNGNSKNKLQFVKIGLIGSFFTFLFLSLLPEVSYLPWSYSLNVMYPSLRLIITLAIMLSISAGFFNSFISISCTTMVQQLVSYKNRGKMFGFLQAMVAFAGLVPILLSGIFADLIGVTSVFYYLALIILVVFIYYIKFINLRWK